MNPSLESLSSCNTILPYPSFVYSVKAGILPGHIYYENIHKENQTIAVDTQLGWFYIGGTPDRAFFQQQLDRFWTKRLQSNERFTLFSASDEWDQIIIEMAPVLMKSIQRQSFHYNPAAEVKSHHVPEGYHLQKINPSIIQKSRLFDERYIIEYWSTIEHYMKYGCGYAVVVNKQTVCECISIVANPICAEIDIQTDSVHRGKGLAFAAAYAFINHILNCGCVPRWDCQEDNKASYQLALKLGFIPSYKHRLWIREVVPIL